MPIAVLTPRLFDTVGTAAYCAAEGSSHVRQQISLDPHVT